MKALVTFLFLMFAIINVQAQPTKSITNKDSYSWMFGLSWVLTDDDGEAYNPFLIQMTYHFSKYRGLLFSY